MTYKGKLIQPLHVSLASHQTTNQSSSLPLNGWRSVQLHPEEVLSWSTATVEEETDIRLLLVFFHLCHGADHESDKRPLTLVNNNTQQRGTTTTPNSQCSWITEVLAEEISHNRL